ncbi:MAG: phytanoyl-CoA dioxygenase family protein [Actinomycetota bacterium]
MPMLTADQIDDFATDGFLVIDRIVDDEAVAELRTAYQRLLDDPGIAAGDRQLGGITRQIMMPSLADPDFDENEVVDAVADVAEQIIGGPVVRLFDMLIYKGPGHPHETPWHQDMAYAQMPFAPVGTFTAAPLLQFWVALDDADAENGCMHFIPGQHERPLLEHVVASGEPDDDGRLLAIRDPDSALDMDQVVPAPLASGGCTVHAYGTWHFTPPNRSATRLRRAYILNFMATDEPG